MEIKSQIAPFHEVDVDALAVVVFEDESPESHPLLKEIDDRTEGTLSALRTANELQGKINELTYLYKPGRLKARRLLFVGGGKPGSEDPDVIRQTAGTVARFVQSKNLKSLAYLCRSELELVRSAQAATEGVLLGLFYTDTYRTNEKENRFLEEVSVVSQTGPVESLERGVSRGKTVAKATNYARNLINEPSSVLTPSELASRATDLASRYDLDITVLDEHQMRELGMGALLGVARGSDEPAKFIILRYTPDGSQSTLAEPIAFVGKGITFDTGGISLKPAENMERMKYDMSGGAAVLGAMRALGQFRPRIPVLGIVPATENMPSGRAQKPGDVARSMSGKTIEVINTDAEGRLILADAISYARQLGAKRIVDLATLTGACVVALGSVYAAIMGNDESFISEVIAAGKEVGERLWPLPLDDVYGEQLKSEIADLKNVGGRKAGTITAGYFLKEFAGDTPWVHLDIAGTAWLDEKKPYLPSGPTGMGVRTLVNLAERLAQNPD